ncbi:MAG TPA: universal stress protein [Acidimicrobiales bacterium]|nr:universal stress protein [Acidimicrobiales bacterium]
MKRIIVGTDGSPGAANALRWAARLASRHGAEVVVMTGFVPVDSELRPPRIEVLLAEQETRLETWSEPARLGELRVRTVVERGDPRPAILAVAEREDADLVVVGRVGDSAGPGVLHLGSMAEWLAHHADRPVAVVGGQVDLSTRTALVAVDGSAGSRAAVRWVLAMRGDADMQVTAASVERVPLEWTPADSPQNWRRDLERRILDDYASELVDAGLEINALARNGADVAGALLQAAKDERSDLVVVGTRGLGGFTGLRVGGVSLKTLHRADRPVVLVPPT